MGAIMLLDTSKFSLADFGIVVAGGVSVVLKKILKQLFWTYFLDTSDLLRLGVGSTSTE